MFKRFDKNEAGSDYVVGDIHGCFPMLQSALDRLGFNPETDRLFSVGDMVDRGPHSYHSLEWLQRPWFHAVRGNHEQMCIESDPGMHLVNGGAWFVSLVDAEQNAIRDEFDCLPIAMEVDTADGLVGIVHAEVPGDDWEQFRSWLISGGVSFEHLERFALWGRDLIRGRSGFSGVSGVGMVCVGHTPLKEATNLHNVLYLDTGACFGKKLTLACIQGPRAGQVIESQ